MFKLACNSVVSLNLALAVDFNKFTFSLTVFAWVFFRAENLSHAKKAQLMFSLDNIEE